MNNNCEKFLGDFMMRLVFTVIVFCLLPFSTRAEERKDIEAQRSYIVFLAEIHSSNLIYLNDVSTVTASSNDDLVLRDLALCEVIGETKGSLQNLVSHSMHLATLMENSEMASEIYRLHSLMIPNIANLTFFCKYKSPLYRNIDQLRVGLLEASNLFEDLNKAIKK
jgi:hypothetical protein